MPNDVPDWTLSFTQLAGELTVADLKVTGLAGAATVSRYVGAVSGAAPTSGTFLQGDYVVDESTTSPGFWVCTVGGTPGTWIRSESLMPVPITIRNDAGNAGQLVLNNPAAIAAGHQVGIDLQANAVNKWFAGMGGGGEYRFRDQVGGIVALALLPSGGQAQFANEVLAPDLSISGLPGAVNANRKVGATTGGAPTSGTFVVGDEIVDRNGQTWVCTVAGTPGTWRRTDGWFGLGTTQLGTAPTLSSRLLLQASSSVGTTDANGLLTIIYPVAFPNGVLCILAGNGDNANSQSMVQVIHANVTGSQFQVGVLTNTGAPVNTLLVRIDWLAIGF